MLLTRSASLSLTLASGSLDSGAPALAASRCQAMASAILSLPNERSACALAAHSSPTASWPLAFLSSSSFSRMGLTAPLSLPLSSLKTSCICSVLGLVAIQSRTLAALSPAVGAENAPPVRASRGWGSGADLAFMEAFLGAVALAAAVAAVSAGVVLLVKNSNIAQYYRAILPSVTRPTFHCICLPFSEFNQISAFFPFFTSLTTQVNPRKTRLNP